MGPVRAGGPILFQHGFEYLQARRDDQLLELGLRINEDIDQRKVPWRRGYRLATARDMEKVAPAIAYRRLKYVSDWRLVEENQRAALAGIVHGISRLDAAGQWGDGTTSASDGHRFAMPHKGLQRISSTRVNDVALECYSCVADNAAPFSSRPIECTARDAPVVLDGVLSHERDLDLDAHDTDTHGYTEINVAAFELVGMRVCPRMRRLHRQRISCADPARDHGVLEPVLQAVDGTPVVAFAAGLVVAIANPGARVVAMVGLSVAWGEIHEQCKQLWIELQQRESATDDLYRRARELDERGTALSRQSTPYRHRPRLLNKCLDQVVAGY